MLAAVIVLAGLAGWEALVRAGVVDALLLPAPTRGRHRAVERPRRCSPPTSPSRCRRCWSGCSPRSSSAPRSPSRCTSRPRVRRALRPLVIGSQAVPVPVIAPLLILVLGFGLAPKVLLVALVCFFPVTINLYDGLRRVDPDARKLLRSFDATRWQSFRLLEAPAALPAAFTGLKVAAAVSVIGAVFAEWAGSDAGLGHALLTANGQLETRARVRRHVPALRARGRALRAVRAARAAGGEVAMRRLARAARARSLLVLAGCGEKDESAPGGGKTEKFNIILDYFPNADHAGIYAAQAAGDYARAGLDVEIKPPPDPSAPLKLLQSGRADLVISYEPELLLARDKGADLVSVGALVQKPLTTLMSLEGHHAPGGPRRQARRHRRHPYQSAYLKTILAKAGVDPDDGQGDQRRLQPRAGDALRQGRRDARRVLELRGRGPQAPRPPPEDPAHGEARRADLRRADLRRPPQGPRRGLLLEAAALPARHRARPPAPAREPGDRASTRC